MSLIRQHLIDPEVCIRCNTCEETCPIDAITHNDDNYVVDVDICNFCMDCIAPCPTGAIDSWRTVRTAYSLEEQLSWDELPEELDHLEEAATEGGEKGVDLDEIDQIMEKARSGLGSGKLVAPRSAGHPYVNMYTREKPAMARVSGNYRLTADDASAEIHHIVLEFGTQAFPVLEGQSIGIVPPGSDDKGRPNMIRLYSVASPRDGERPNHNNLALTVKRERFDLAGETRHGVCSDYLCNLKRGDEVQVTGPFGSTFLMPNDPEANLIMICTGTGSAPFRAMTERRRRNAPDAPGRLLLFFGARTPGELPYHGPLKKLPDSLVDKELVFSRLPDSPREYVQDRMRRRSDDVAALLQEPDTHIYICGLKGMEQGVDEALSDICRDHSMDWAALRPALRESGRFHVETY